MPQQREGDRLRVRLAVLVVAIGAGSFAAAQKPEGGVQCRADGALVRVQDLTEGSGVAVSRRNPERAWAHNDSGKPVLVSLDGRGTVTGRVQLTGAAVEDWEAIAVGPCPAGSCLYIGDVGDNDGVRTHITIYRIPEPGDANTSVAAKELFHATYPDGPQDAEALLVTPNGEILVVTKGETGPVAIYRFPREMRAGSTVQLARVGKSRETGRAGRDARITDGAVSPNGEWIALRTNRTVSFYRTSDLMAGNWREAGRVDLGELAEPQGEGVAFADDTTLFVVGEGGGKRRPGTFGRLTCTF